MICRILFVIFEKKTKMIVERQNNEILIRFPENSGASKVQSILDYLRYEELTSKSRATDKDLDQLIKESKTGRWDRLKKDLGFE